MDLSIIATFLGGFILVFGLCSSFLKERLCLSEAPIAVAFGILLGPACANFISFATAEEQESFTLGISRVIIDLQVMAVGLTLPNRYIWDEWLSMLLILLAGMSLMWVVSAALVEALVPGMDFLAALMIAACFTPTDPVLSNAIVQGPYAERNVRAGIRYLIAAESAANDGLGYPFLFLAVYLMKLSGGEVVKEWVIQAVLRGVLLSVAIGALLGTGARLLLKKCHEWNLIDKEWLELVGFAMGIFLLGVVSLVTSDDLLACFTAGVALSWDEWFSRHTRNSHFLQVLDPLLNVIIFTYIGATMPWQAFVDLSLWRLFVLAILVILLRRVPSTLLLYKFVPAIYDWQEALFTGWFGPIGVGAIFYYATATDIFTPDGPFAYARATLLPVVYFIVLASVVVHGFSIPVWVGTRVLWQLCRGERRASDLFSLKRNDLSRTDLESIATTAVDGNGNTWMTQQGKKNVLMDLEKQAIGLSGKTVITTTASKQCDSTTDVGATTDERSNTDIDEITTAETASPSPPPPPRQTTITIQDCPPRKPKT
ncbi:related to na h-exchanging protein [Lichtheimia corymbifera JMRC:FSU:9682]|uniref:Related to na h-exchanging protein n=1 Tax=Lichtheimia corymbifera JMRC:FSU:9682 TaxID=1263082 RepID=A0A068SAJ7_9FUNG|nr:related to na h-exchanging protein [Lichtheimia corymbifera JMRC:FSU:9682]